MVYTRHNVTGLGDGTNTFEFIQGVFNLSGGILGVCMLIIIFTVSFITLSQTSSTRDSLAASLFVTLIFSFILMSAGMLLGIYVISLCILFALVVMSYIFK